MGILDRYLLRQFLKPLAFCLAAFLMIWILFDLLGDNLTDFVSLKFKFREVLLFYWYILPRMLVVVLPLSLMLALLYCLTVMSRHNEITAMRASGIGIGRLLVPYLGVGTVCAVVVFVLSENVVARSFGKAEEFASWKRNRTQAVRPLFYTNRAAHREWMADEFHLQNSSDPVRGELLRVKLWELSPAKIPVRVHTAEKAVWSDGVWRFYEIVTVPFDESGKPIGGFRNLPVEPERVIEGLTETPDQMRRAALLQKSDYMTIGELRRRIGDKENPPPQSLLGELRMAYYDRFAFPWICVVVILLGIPFGITTSRRGMMIGVVNSLALFFAYYFFITVDRALGQHGHIPPLLAAWLPNVAFALVGFFLLRRVR
jgi:lipopolysaccharide export system permease protein